MRRVAILLAVLWPTQALCQNLDVRTLEVLSSASAAHSAKDLVQIAAANSAAGQEGVFWRDAIAISEGREGGTPAGRAAVTRLMEIEVLVEGQPPSAGDLDRLTDADIKALKASADMPEPYDLLYYLLARGPSVRDAFTGEEYVVVRLAQDNLHILFERATAPYFDLGPGFARRELAPTEDPVAVPPGERAKTRRIMLAAIPEVTLAAKALRISSMVSVQRKTYPTYIAYNALRRAFAADQASFRMLLWRMAPIATKAAEAATEPVMRGRAERLRTNLPATAFYAREFPEAARLYHNAAVNARSATLAFWAAWGEALSVFAAGQPAGNAFAHVAGMLSTGSPKYSYILKLLLENLSAGDKNSIGDISGLIASINNNLKNTKIRSEDTLDWHMEFLRIAENVGRPDIAICSILPKLEALRGQPLERPYLLELGASVRDLYYLISFEMSPTADWIPRAVAGYPLNLDFLHDVLPDGRLAGPGDVVLLNDETALPYSRTNPEADLATAFAAYGIVSVQAATTIVAATEADRRRTMVAGFEKWARESAERATPSASIVPYLKLVWLEWFGQAFEPLKDRSLDPARFTYIPTDASQITRPRDVTALLDHPAATTQQKELIRMFLHIREFLEYAHSPH